MAHEVFHVIIFILGFKRNKPARVNGVNGLNGRTVHEFVEEERVKGIAFATIQHHPMEDKTVLGTD